MARARRSNSESSESEAAESEAAVGAAVRELRGDRTQAQLAEEMRRRYGRPWSQATVWSIERGTRPLRLREAQDLADLCEVPLTAVLSGPDQALGQLRIRSTREALRNAQLAAEVANERVRELETQLAAVVTAAEAMDAARDRHGDVSRLEAEAVLELIADAAATAPSLGEIIEVVRQQKPTASSEDLIAATRDLSRRPSEEG